MDAKAAGKGMSLLEIRDQLDVIDRQLTSLYQERMEYCAEVANIKIKSGKQVLDAKREQEKLAAVESFVESDFDKKAVRELFSQIMTISRRLQFGIMTENGLSFDIGFQKTSCIPVEGKKVVYQGVPGAYAHIAALRSFPEGTELFHVKTWKDALDEVAEGKADYAVLPIENSSHGAVTDNFDLLLRYPTLAIVQEIDLPVQHALLSVEGADIKGLREVYSHPQAIGQCQHFFETHPYITPVSVLNTAVAAELVSERQDKTIAALSSEEAGRLYPLSVLEHAVNQEKTNTTRFLILGREKIYTDEATKTSICFETQHKPGALYNVLGNFIFNDVNMIMLQSRPIPEKPFEYRFFCDIEGNLATPKIINALNGMHTEVTEFRILGCY